MGSLPVESFEKFFLNLVADRLERLARRYRQEGLEKHYLALCTLLHYYREAHLSPQMKSQCIKLDLFKGFSRG